MKRLTVKRSFLVSLMKRTISGEFLPAGNNLSFKNVSTTTVVESVQRYLYELNKELRAIEYPVTFDQYLRGEQ